MNSECSWVILRQGVGDFISLCSLVIGSKGHNLELKMVPGAGLSHQPPLLEAGEMSASEGLCGGRPGLEEYTSRVWHCPP